MLLIFISKSQELKTTLCIGLSKNYLLCIINTVMIFLALPAVFALYSHQAANRFRSSQFKMCGLFIVQLQSWREANNLKKFHDILKQEDNFAQQARCYIREAYSAQVYFIIAMLEKLIVLRFILLLLC